MKWKKRKITLPDVPEKFFREAVERFKLVPLSFSSQAAVLQASLPLHHKDPHDHMLTCQALAHRLTILTPDEEFRKYDVKVVW